MALHGLGSNCFGQLALDSEIDSTYKPMKIEFFDDKKITKLSAGKIHTLVLCDNKVYSWGINDDCALGRLTEEISQESVPLEVEFEKKFKGKIADICGGVSFSAILVENGTVYTCGTFKNSSGALGNTPKIRFQNKFRQVENLKRITKIFAGHNHLLMIDNKKNVWALGVNQHGQQGITHRSRFAKRCLEPSQITSCKPKQISTHFYKASGGGFHSFIINELGECFGIGANFNGQLGIGTTTNVEPITKISISDVIDVKCGLTHSLFLLRNGDLYGCGDNSHSQLGIDGERMYSTPTLIMKKVQKVWAGHECTFIQSEEKFYSCGVNMMGECGFDSANSVIKTPTLVFTDISGIKDLAIGCDFTVVLSE